MAPISGTINLRQALEAKLSGATHQELRETIEDAIQSREEMILPGLGYLFEILWKHVDEAERSRILDVLARHFS
ncbi:MAG: small acid-soluble spore protein SspI [Brockia lithotrophica]|nr:small acid-soluble spore protein SspI [Brockia lithotrophica]MBT9252329.1 small acid-soluble spore protein SspI [Brockia lithotrophica]